MYRELGSFRWYINKSTYGFNEVKQCHEIALIQIDYITTANQHEGKALQEHAWKELVIRSKIKFRRVWNKSVTVENQLQW